MPPEIDNSQQRAETLPLIDFYSFNQGTIPGEKNPASNPGQSSGTLEFSDPYGFNQGRLPGAKALSGAGSEQRGFSGSATAGTAPAALDGHLMPDPFGFNQGDNSPGGKPGPFVPPPDLRPLPTGDVAPGPVRPVEPAPPVEPVQPAKPGDNIPRPGDNIPKPGDRPLPSPNDSASGISPIVAAYERRQGARHAGTGTLPAIDPIPNDLTPPSPGPGPVPGPLPDIAPWKPPKPDVNPNITPTEFHPQVSDLISKMPAKYDTSDIAAAVKMAEETGLPLALHVGATWCGACQYMEQNIWPQAEGTAGQKGDLQGKMVVLHLDVDQVRSLQGHDRQLADQLLRNQGNAVPFERVFKVDPQGNMSQAVREHVGAFNTPSELEDYLRSGGVGTTQPRPDVNPNPSPNPNPTPRPGPLPNPGHGPELPPWNPSKPGDNPGTFPDIAPWTPIKPGDHPNPSPDKPDHSDLIKSLEPKYETDNVATAVKMAKETGLPLAVHIGATWCGYCQEMEQNVWPGVEGTADRKGSLQGKMVVLHMDVDEARNLQGENRTLADQILRNRGGSVPLERVFKVNDSGNLQMTAQHTGAISSRSGLERFLESGGIQP